MGERKWHKAETNFELMRASLSQILLCSLFLRKLFSHVSSLSVTLIGGVLAQRQTTALEEKRNKTDQNKWDASGSSEKKLLPGGSDCVIAPVMPFKIRLGSDPFPLLHSGSLSVCVLVTLKPFKGDGRDRGEFLL